MDSMLWKGSGQSDLKQVIFEQNGGSMFLIVEKKDRSEKWKLENALKKTENAVLYHGLSVREMLFSGEDLLAEEILRTGCLDRQCLEGLFPQVNGYALLGSAASWSGLTVHLDGEIRLQTTGGSDNTFCLFHPRQIHPQIGAVKPCFSLLDDYLPILVSCYEGQNGYMLLVQFCEYQDSDRNPTLWTWAHIVHDDEESNIYLRSSYSRHITQFPISAQMYFETLSETVDEWHDELGSLCHFELPDQQLDNDIKTIMGSVYLTFSGDHPHYGHKFYGQETHDWFPPTLLSYIETTFFLGHLSRTRRALEHYLHYGIGRKGTLAYRQGEEEINGTSASEYGQILWMIERVEQALQPAGWIEEYLDKITDIGKALVDKIQPYSGRSDFKVISMCAEADTNNRIHVYAHNNLWAARGLCALAVLLKRYGRPFERIQTAGENLRHDILSLLEREKIDSRFGSLVPFRLGYPADVHTLSGCRTTFYPLSDEEYASYKQVSWCREDVQTEQDYVENCYANYRYYPEMLSSGLLKPDYEEALVNMRRHLGGELCGMTRFMDQIDDWPVSHYARYLLRSGQKERYLLLMYAHLLNHGDPSIGVYYEQRALAPNCIAPDCVPSALTVPLMLSWMFVFENEEGTHIDLLKGVPDQWLKEGFVVSGLVTRWGKVKMKCHKGILSFSMPIIGKSLKITVFGYHRQFVFKSEEISGKEMSISLF